MQKASTSNRLALVSFISGITALIAIAVVFIFYTSSETQGGAISIIDGIVMPIRNLSVGLALITGIFALREIKKTGGTTKDRIFSWFGIVIGTGWILFGIFVGLLFSLPLIFP